MVHQAERMCIGCGKKGPPRAFFRLICPERTVQTDDFKRAGGRGGYVCGAACVERAEAKKAFQRAFRRQIDPQSIQSVKRHIHEITAGGASGVFTTGGSRV